MNLMLHLNCATVQLVSLVFTLSSLGPGLHFLLFFVLPACLRRAKPWLKVDAPERRSPSLSVSSSFDFFVVVVVVSRLAP
jgi:hypothetical protein